MKLKIYILLVLTGAIVGCKKNEGKLDYSGIKPVILVPTANWPGKSLWDQPMDSLFGVEKLNLSARVSYANPLDHPVKVTFKPAPELLGAYNNRWYTSYEWLPDDAYQIPTFEVTIPAGKKEASIPITVFPQKISGFQGYFIAFTISSADKEIIAANSKSMVFTLKGQ